MKNSSGVLKGFNQPDYVDAGQRLLRQLGSGSSVMRFSDLDVVYTHPTGGGRVYIGNLMAAQNLSILKGKEITRVVGDLMCMSWSF